MMKSSFIKIIRTFSSEEQMRFSAFIRSPYFGMHKTTALVYSEILIQVKDNETDTI
jgi:hypothetical protein